MSVDLLVQKIKEKGNPSVAGLDPKIEYVPEYIRKKAYAEYGQNLKGATEAIWEFNKGLTTIFPPTITYSGLPQRVKPSNGEFLLFDWNFEISTVHSFDGSNIVISASASIDKLPLLILSILDGLTAIFSISSFKVKTPDFTRY